MPNKREQLTASRSNLLIIACGGKEAGGVEGMGRGRRVGGRHGTPEFFCHRPQTSMTRASVEDRTADLGQTLRTGRPLVILPRRLGAVHEFSGTQAAGRN